jgi:hypothetical protein
MKRVSNIFHNLDRPFTSVYAKDSEKIHVVCFEVPKMRLPCISSRKGVNSYITWLFLTTGLKEQHNENNLLDYIIRKCK